MAICLALYPFKDSSLDQPPPQIASKPALLCVHGFFHNETAWGFYRRELQKRGLGPVHHLCYHSIRWDIPENSGIVQARVEEIKQKTGKDVQILIGHSLGGLICLEYALEHAPKDRTTYIITLGTPLHGTTMTRFGMGPSVTQMEINSSYLKQLHKRLTQAKHLRLLALAGDKDWVIQPHTSALLTEYPYASTTLLPGMGHIAFLFSPEAVEHIVAFLKREGIVF